MLEIIPGILEQEWSEIEKKLEVISTFSPAVHIDLLDGEFAPNKTFFDPTPFAPWTEKLHIELHLMVKDPVSYIDAWGKVGVKRFLGHIEQMPDQNAFLQKAQEYGEGGLALDGKTPLENITVDLTTLKSILIMTIDAGFSGQEFIPAYAEKCAQLREQAPELVIEVDGGIHADTLSVAKAKGASRFVCTSALFNSGNPEEIYHHLTAL